MSGLPCSRPRSSAYTRPVDVDRPAPRVRPTAQRAASARGTRGGSARPNIADIAALAKVSTSAVSYALNGRDGVSESTRQRILEIAESMNWRPSSAARALITERAGAVGLVNVADPRYPALSSDFAGEFLTGVQDELRRHDVFLVMHLVDTAQDALAVYQQWLGERRVDGVLVLNPLREDPRLPVLERLGLPAVVVGDVRGSSGLVSCWSDTAEAMTLMVDHLVELGHTRIARVGGAPSLHHTRKRGDAFRRALAGHGLVPDRRVARGRMNPDIVAGAVRARRDPLTAILVEETTPAIQLLASLSDTGVSVPEEVSVASLDDVARSALVRPALTVLHRGVDDYGRRATRALLRVIEDGVHEHAQGTFSTLVARDSTAPPPSR